MALDGFMAGYYRNPEPAIAIESFRAWRRSPPADPAADARIASLFVRAIQRFPDVRAAFEGIRAESDRVPQLLAAAADSRFPDPAQARLENPGDLDWLWGEFLLSGEREPVLRIASVLSWEDRVRSSLLAWTAERVYLPWSRSARAAKRKALALQGIGEDGAPGAAPLDLDLVAWKRMAGGWKIRQELPFPIDERFAQHLAMKGSACWSLQSNARQHPIVRAIYEAIPGIARLPQMG